MSKQLHTIVATILLWLIGLISVTLIKGINLSNDLKSSSVYIVELDTNILPGQKIIAESLIKDIKGIQEGSMTIIPKGQAADIMISELPEIDNYNQDIFRDIITFKLGKTSAAEIASIRRDVLDIGGVTGFFHEQEIFNGINSGISRFRMSLLVLSVVLFIAVILVILYALRQAFALQKENIVAMFLAGATPKVIMKPYIVSAIKRALKTALIAIIILVVNILLINRMLLQGIEVSFLQTLAACVLVMVISMTTYYLTTYNTTNSYLNQFKISSS